MKNNRLALIAMMAVLLFVAAACGSGNRDNGAGQAVETPAAQLAASPSPTAGPKVRVVHSAKGDVTIPAVPERVIGNYVAYPEFLVALGVTPVAAPNYYKDYPTYLREPFRQVLKIGSGNPVNFEAILSASPDLILIPTGQEKDYDQLSKIAPTVMLPKKSDWREQLTDMAEVLGRQQEAERALQQYDRKTSEAKDKLKNIVGDGTVLYLTLLGKQMLIYGENSARGKVLYKELGLHQVAAYPAGEASLPLSMEILPKYDADYILLTLDGEVEEVKTQYEGLLQSSLWKNMKAVKNSRVYMMGTEDWFNVGYAPLANEHAINDILTAFEQGSGKRQ